MTSNSLEKIQEDTIVAISTAIGGAISIVRLSGSKALNIALSVWAGSIPKHDIIPRKVYLGNIIGKNKTTIDTSLLIYMKAPHSYTGEDIVELQCHGGSLSTANILSLIASKGARHAEAGEFTKRAFLNSKIDLTQAEAVLDVIEAHSSMALHTANKQLNGLFGQNINILYEETKEILADIEARMDFSEEDLEFENVSTLSSKLNNIKNKILEYLKTKHEGEILRHGIKLVIAGPPNAGKSSLLNLILGRNRAIVTDIPGTTRDTLEEFAHIRGIPIRVSDTAGIRKSSDIIEQAGVEISLELLKRANIILWVIDSSFPYSKQAHDRIIPNKSKQIIVCNKADIVKIPPNDIPANLAKVSISAKTGKGYDKLLDTIEKLVWETKHSVEPDIAINTRHANLLENTQNDINLAINSIENQELEITSIYLRSALENIGKIIGKTVEPDILHNIFSKFCIGK